MAKALRVSDQGTERHVLVRLKAICCLVPTPGERTTTSVVFFLGGCTYTEIAALRWAGRQTQGKLVITSNVCSDVRPFRQVEDF